MSDNLITVEQAAEQLNLHPKTVLRYIRDGRLPATRIGKSYRIARARLEAFAGLAGGKAEEGAPAARVTSIVDIPGISVEGAERLASFLHSIALAGNAGTPPLHLKTAYDPGARAMKLVMIGTMSDVGKLLEMLHLQMTARA